LLPHGGRSAIRKPSWDFQSGLIRQPQHHPLVLKGERPMTSAAQPRAQLVSMLWSLKQAIRRKPLPGITHVHFNSLLRQPSYRREILDAALNSGDEELSRLAEEAESLDIDGAVLLNPEEKQWLEQRDRDMVAAYSAELEAAGRAKRRYALAAVAVTVVAVLSVVTWLGVQQLDSGTVVEGTISGEVRWTEGDTYILEGIVDVAPGARLTIDPGVAVAGRPGSALVVSRGGFLRAKGTATQPIVLTSSQAEGKRQAGDWGGLVLLGAAPINAGEMTIEGFTPGDERGLYGGEDPAHACGVLEYVRIEFAGFEALANNELNGLTLGGCGNTSVVRYVQVHRALDDGVEVFGGTVNLKHVLITQARDDGLDWDEGWTGSAQFLIIQQTQVGDNAIEADNNSDDPDARPRSRPLIYNATLIGSDSGAQRAMTLRNGTSAEFGSILASRFGLEFADVRGAETAALAAEGDLRFDALVLHRIGPPDGNQFANEAADEDDDGGFNEAEFFLNADSTESSASLRPPVRSQNASSPDFVPSGSSALRPAALPKTEFWDESARFIGAVRAGDTAPWYLEWTAFPEH
jgi:hypothetical protein